LAELPSFNVLLHEVSFRDDIWEKDYNSGKQFGNQLNNVK
jgi:hypothetical protein